MDPKLGGPVAILYPLARLGGSMSVASVQELVAGPYPHLDWLPDETLFSLCSRQHLILGNLAPATTSHTLLGLAQQFIKHDIPCGIATLEQAGFQHWGSPESILFNRTIFPIFVPFQNQVNIKNAIRTIKGSRLDSLKYRLGLVSSGFGAEHPLKACPYCMHEDVNAHGIAYWHLSHQYPGVLICPDHQAWLMASTKSRRWSGRFEWSLPAEDYLIAKTSYQELWSRPDFLVLARNVIDLASVGRLRSFEPCTVARTYRNAVLKGVQPDEFLERIRPLRHFHLFESLPADEESVKSFVNQLIRTPRRNIHPLKHLVLINWLFEGLHPFLEAYETEVAKPAQQVTLTQSRVPDERGSLSSAAIPSTNTPRPKRLKGQLKEDLLSKLARGVRKHELCEEFQITVSTINKLLRATPATYALAIEAKHGRKRDEQRREWQLLHGLFPELGVQALRSKMPALYAWLYRNDKTWLMAEEKDFAKPLRVVNRPVDWEARDCRLLHMIRTACGSISEVRHDPIMKEELFAIVPTLSSCLENRDRYPVSRAYLSTVLARSSSTDHLGHEPSAVEPAEPQ